MMDTPAAAAVVESSSTAAFLRQLYRVWHRCDQVHPAFLALGQLSIELHPRAKPRCGPSYQVPSPGVVALFMEEPKGVAFFAVLPEYYHRNTTALNSASPSPARAYLQPRPPEAALLNSFSCQAPPGFSETPAEQQIIGRITCRTARNTTNRPQDATAQPTAISQYTFDIPTVGFLHQKHLHLLHSSAGWHPALSKFLPARMAVRDSGTGIGTG